MDAMTKEFVEAFKVSTPESSTPASNISSYFASSNDASTRVTTPGGITSGGFRTIIVNPKELGSIMAIDQAFKEYEPFRDLCCAFCSSSSGNGTTTTKIVTCKCQTLATINSEIPKTKKKLLRYLEMEEIEAGHIQAATLAYLLVLEKHVPFGLEFNLDQQAKCGIMNRQLEDVKNRISDIRKALYLLDKDKTQVSDGILGACNYFRTILGLCLGNARENHICFKLNFKLFTK